MFQMVKEIVDQSADQTRDQIHWEDPKDICKVIKEIFERKRKEDPKSTREIVKEIQELSKRGSFKPIVQPWSRDLPKLSRDLQSTINLFSSIRSSVHPLWENSKRGSSFE